MFISAAVLTVAFAVHQCEEFGTRLSELYDAGDHYSQTRLSLAEYSCRAAMRQANMRIANWECIVNPHGGNTVCEFELEELGNG